MFMTADDFNNTYIADGSVSTVIRARSRFSRLTRLTRQVSVFEVIRKLRSVAADEETNEPFLIDPVLYLNLTDKLWFKRGNLTHLEFTCNGR